MSRRSGILRLLGGAAATAVGVSAVLLTGAAPAYARQRWTSSFSSALPNPVAIDSSAVTVAGSFIFDPGAGQSVSIPQEIDKINVTLTRTGPAQPGCDGLSYPQAFNVANSWEGGAAASSNRNVPFSFTFSPACNGTYEARVSAIATGYLLVIPTSETSPALVNSGVQMVAPPPAVGGLQATLSGNDVRLSWSAPAAYATGAPPDFTGYVIERKVGVDFQAVGSVDTATTQYVDAGALASPGSQEYRVRASRRGASADQFVLSVVGESTSRSVTKAPPKGSTTTTASGSTTTTGRSPSTTTGSRTGTTTRSTGSRTATTRPRTSSPTSSRSSSRSSTATGRRSGSPPSIGALPFGDGLDDLEPGEADPVLPDGQLASGPALQSAGGESGERALLTPIAIGVVLLVWAAHLRFLSRQARVPALVVDGVRGVDRNSKK